MKKALALLSAIACAVALFALPASAAATIDAALGDTSILLGESTHITGVVSPADATPNVVVQRRIAGRWHDRNVAAVDPVSGAYDVTIKPSGAGDYVLRVRSGGGSVVTPPMTLLVWPPSISTQLGTTSSLVGTTVFVEGTVRPATATPQVVVQRFTANGWSDRGSGAVDPTSGSYRIAVAPSQAGTYLFRVRSKGGTVNSPTVTLTVRRPTPVAPPPAPVAPPSPAPSPGPACSPHYTPCVPIASDVDCAGGSGNGPAYVSGPVYIIDVDVYGLDGNDNDGIGCEG